MENPRLQAITQLAHGQASVMAAEVPTLLTGVRPLSAQREEFHRGSARVSEVHRHLEARLHSEQEMVGELREAARPNSVSPPTVSPSAGTERAGDGSMPILALHVHRDEMRANKEASRSATHSHSVPSPPPAPRGAASGPGYAAGAPAAAGSSAVPDCEKAIRGSLSSAQAALRLSPPVKAPSPTAPFRGPSPGSAAAGLCATERDFGSSLAVHHPAARMEQCSGPKLGGRLRPSHRG